MADGSGNPIVTYTYDADGRLSKKTNGNGTYTTYAYDGAGNVLQLTNYAPGGAVNSSFGYTYNTLGLETTETTIDGAWAYAYDADGELAHAVFTPNSTNPDGLTAQNLTYNYDAMGNRTSTVINGVTTAYTVNNMNQYTSVGGVAYSYDKNGDLLSDGVNTYTYNVLHQLTGITTPTGTTSYTYNALGQQVASSSGGQTTQYLIDPAGLGNIVATLSGSNAVLAHFTYGLGLSSIVLGSGGSANTYSYDFEAFGSTAGLTSSSGAYVDKYAYFPFGQIAFSASAVPNPFQFEGQLGVTSETNGLYTMRERTYASTLGRFLSVDRLGLAAGTSDFYEYAFNSPQQIADPAGLAPDPAAYWKLAASAGQYGAGYATGVGTNVATGQNADAAGNVVSSAINVPGLPGAGSAVGFALDPNHAQDIANGITGIQRMAKGKSLNPADDAAFNLIDNPDAPDPGGGDRVGGGSSFGVNATDPNALYGPAGYGSGNYIAPAAGQTFPYQVDFENSPTATAPAQEVTVSEQLAPNLDWSTFQLTGIGFGNTFITIPAGVQNYQTTVSMTYLGQTFDVEIQAGIHGATGQVYAIFQSLDPATHLPPSNPLIGFLPPEDGTGRGSGYLSYSISPKAGLATGTAIKAVALVTFDQGLSIATDQVNDEDPTQGISTAKQALVTIDVGAPTSTVAALPASESSSTFTVNWSGQDDAGGSGVASYSVYVSDDGGAYQPFVLDSTSTSAQFAGQVGQTYSFYSVATDNVGNVQPTPTSAQATTTIVAGPTVTGISPATGPAIGGTSVIINGTGFTGATAVDFGTTPAISFTVNSDGTQITALDPAGSGTVDVTVVGASGGISATSAADQFTYAASAVSVTSVVVNGNNPALAGVQRSMVDSIVYTFNQAVTLAAGNAFSIALNASYAAGALPTLTWTAISPNTDGSSTQWVVTFSGSGVLNGSIGDGVYNITINGSAVTADANPAVTATSRTDTFYRLFGDATGAGSVSGTDYNALLSTFNLKTTAAGYVVYFNEDGASKIDAPNYNAFLANFGMRFKNVTSIATI